jgi:hypothetical protein
MSDDRLEQIQGDLDMQVITQWQIKDQLRNIRNNQAVDSLSIPTAKPQKIGRLGGKEFRARSPRE